MKELKVGIVGLGWVAGAHLETFKGVSGAKVAAICSRRKLDAAALSAQYGTPLKVYNDYAKMLADPEIDIIDICTPNPCHAEQAIAAAQAGKHLIIEKPIAISFEDVKAVRKAIQKAKVKTCVCFEVRFSSQFAMTKSVIDAGLLGELHYAEVDYYHGIGPWYAQFAWNIKKDAGGSSLLSAGCHSLDALLYVMADQAVEVTSYNTQSRNKLFAPYEYRTTSVSIIKFRNGAVGKVASSIDCFQPYYFHVHLVGSEGSLLDNKFYSAKLDGVLKSKWSSLETRMVDSGDVHEHPYQPQFQAFADGIQKDQVMPLTDFESAYESHRVIFAADLSAKEGRPVKLSELR